MMLGALRRPLRQPRKISDLASGALSAAQTVFELCVLTQRARAALGILTRLGVFVVSWGALARTVIFLRVTESRAIALSPLVFHRHSIPGIAITAHFTAISIIRIDPVFNVFPVLQRIRQWLELAPWLYCIKIVAIRAVVDWIHEGLEFPVDVAPLLTKFVC